MIALPSPAGGALASGELVGQSIRLSIIAFYTRLLPTLARAQRSAVHAVGLTPVTFTDDTFTLPPRNWLTHRIFGSWVRIEMRPTFRANRDGESHSYIR